MEKVVIAKCVSCEHQQDIKEGQEPICEKCFSPMVAVRAELREDFL
jgi:hypothetical protein